MSYTMAAVPTMYVRRDGRQILMDSALESGFAMWLDQWMIPWEYHPTPIASPHGRWAPDFLLKGLTCHRQDYAGADLLVEVKHQNWAAGDPEMFGRTASLMAACATVSLLAQPGCLSLIWAGGAMEVKLYSGPDYQATLGYAVPSPWPDGWWKGIR